MSGEKIDLDLVYRSAALLPPHWHQRASTLALVAAVRAAIKARGVPDDVIAAYNDLDAALSPFTDTAPGAGQPDSAESDKRGAQGAEQREGRCDGE